MAMPSVLGYRLNVGAFAAIFRELGEARAGYVVVGGVAVFRAVLMMLEGVEVPVASIADLLTMKRIAGRPKDVEDIAALEAIVKRTSG